MPSTGTESPVGRGTPSRAKISQQTTYIGGEKTLGEVEGVLEKLSGSKSGKHGR